MEKLVKFSATIDHHAPIVTGEGIRDMNAITMAFLNTTDEGRDVCYYLVDAFPGYFSEKLWVMGSVRIDYLTLNK